MKMTSSDKYRTQAICIASLFWLLNFLLLVHLGYGYKSSKTNEIIQEDALQKAKSAIKNIKRDFKSLFAGDLLPVMVEVVLLFAILTIITKGKIKLILDSVHMESWATAPQFFLLFIRAHSSLRTRISISEIIYLEYFYFVMYIAILVVGLNSIAFASNRHIPFIDAKDNMHMKALHWSVIMGILLFITILKFYWQVYTMWDSK